jgi:monoamine oxidase
VSEAEKDEPFGHRTVTDAAIAAFGVLTGDYARLHFDHDLADNAGGRIAHGLLGASWALGALTLHAPERLGVGAPGHLPSSFSVRFSASVLVGDTLSCRLVDEQLDAGAHFEVVNQRGEPTSRGEVGVRDWSGGPPHELPEAWPGESWTPLVEPSVFHAEDLLEHEFRGDSVGRTLTEAEAVGFATQVGELNPLYLNGPFAAESPFAERLVSPMFVFCTGFADFLRELLRVPMPDAGFAGHLGDAWRALAPVHIGDTLRTRFRTLSYRPSQSRPEMAIVRFGLQLRNQREELVQDGEVVMMIPRRPSA